MVALGFHPAATRPRPLNVIIDCGKRTTRDIMSQPIFAGTKLFVRRYGS